MAEVVDLDAEEIWVRIDGEQRRLQTEKGSLGTKKIYFRRPKKYRRTSFGQFPAISCSLGLGGYYFINLKGLLLRQIDDNDAGKSFASGQVYVALSRCRTLEGIVLKSKITKDVIFSDKRVSQFQDSTNANDQIEEILNSEKYDYSIRKVLRYLDVIWIKRCFRNLEYSF